MLIITKGKIKFLNGYFEKFLSCHKLKITKIHKEADSTNQVDIDTMMPTLYINIASYNMCDIYNINEIKLFYNMVPNSTIAQQQITNNKKIKK